VDGRLVTFGQTDDSTLLWSSQDSDPITLHGIPFHQHRASPPHLMVTRSAAEEVRLWNWRTESGLPLCRCRIPRELQHGRTRFARISPDGSRFALSYDVSGQQGAELWSADGDRLATLVGVSAPRVDAERLLIVGSGFQRDTGAIVTGAQNGTVWIWSPDGQPMAHFVADRGSPDALLDLEVDPRGEFIATGVRSSVGLWNWSGNAIATLNTVGYKVFRVGFAPDGSRILTISDNPWGSPSYYVQWWDRDGTLLKQLDAPGVVSTSEVEFDVQGRYLLLRSGTDLRIFDMINGELLGVLAAARGVHLNAVAMSPDGNRIGALFSDGVVRIWSIDERRRIMSIAIGSPGPFIFNADGRRLLVAMPSGVIEQHALDISDLYAGAAARLDRGFDLDEVRRFAIQEPVKLNLAQYGRS
jgi:WD40 repeat protein